MPVEVQDSVTCWMWLSKRNARAVHNRMLTPYSVRITNYQLTSLLGGIKEEARCTLYASTLLHRISLDIVSTSS